MVKKNGVVGKDRVSFYPRYLETPHGGHKPSWTRVRVHHQLLALLQAKTAESPPKRLRPFKNNTSAAGPPVKSVRFYLLGLDLAVSLPAVVPEDVLCRGLSVGALLLLLAHDLADPQRPAPLVFVADEIKDLRHKRRVVVLVPK